VDKALLSLVIAGGAFCGSHVLLSSTRLRGSLCDQLGERGFLAVYSLTSLVTFAWFVAAYAAAPTVVLCEGIGERSRETLGESNGRAVCSCYDARR
jgi:hypothetical protein